MASISLKDEVLTALMTCEALTIEKTLAKVTLTTHASRVSNILEELRKARVVTYDVRNSTYTINVPRAVDRAPVPEAVPVIERTRAKKAVILDLHLKLNVLNKLAPLMADGISEVLTAIKADLQQASQ